LYNVTEDTVKLMLVLLAEVGHFGLRNTKVI
jgi:hypothetical protein